MKRAIDILLALFAAVSAFADDLMLARQKRTLADMRTLAISVEAYATDNNKYPKVTFAELEKLMHVVILLVAQTADPTHLSIEAAARALGVSAKTIRRRIAAGSLTLESIPGSRRCGIRIDELYDGWWVPLVLARKLVDDERGELQALKTKSR